MRFADFGYVGSAHLDNLNLGEMAQDLHFARATRAHCQKASTAAHSHFGQNRNDYVFGEKSVLNQWLARIVK